MPKIREGVQAFKAAVRGELEVGCTGCGGGGCDACDNVGSVLCGFSATQPLWKRR